MRRPLSHSATPQPAGFRPALACRLSRVARVASRCQSQGLSSKQCPQKGSAGPKPRSYCFSSGASETVACDAGSWTTGFDAGLLGGGL